MILFGKKAFLDNINEVNNVEVLKGNNEIISLLKSKKIKFEIKDDKYFFSNYGKVNHQGIVSFTKNNRVCELADLLKDKSEKAIVVVLDEIQDPYNFGNIIRSCEAFGVKAIIYKQDNQVQINDYVIKSSMGAINNINLIKVVNLSNTLELLKKNKFWVYSTSLGNSSKSLYKTNFDNKTVLVFGNENNGVSKKLIEASDFLVKIPMVGKVESLNVSTSVGIVVSYVSNLLK